MRQTRGLSSSGTGPVFTPVFESPIPNGVFMAPE